MSGGSNLTSILPPATSPFPSVSSTGRRLALAEEVAEILDSEGVHVSS